MLRCRFMAPFYAFRMRGMAASFHLGTWFRGGPERGFYKPGRGKLHAYYFVPALLALVLSTAGFAVITRGAVAGEAPMRALLDWIHLAMSQPLATLLLAMPFIAAELTAVEIERVANRRTAQVVFFASLAAISCIYLAGYWAAQHAAVRRDWQAASLALGLMPFKSMPVLVLAALAGLYSRTKFRQRN
jgi:hypothetical protein